MCKPDPREVCSSGCCDGQRTDSFNEACVPQVPVLEKEDPNNPSCCKDKPSPCCDVACLDRIALRECDKELPSSKCQSHDGKPCDQHRRSARAKFGSKLDALGCICRALIALGQESCCAPPPRATSIKSARRSAESLRRTQRAWIDSCCSTGSEKCRTPSVKGSEEACSSDCCGGPKTAEAPKQESPRPIQRTSLDSCCSTGPEKRRSGEESSSGCCSAPKASEKCVSTEKEKTVNHGSCCSTTAAVEQHTSVTKRASSETKNCSDGCCGKPEVNQSPNIQKSPSCGKENPDRSACSAGCCSKPTLNASALPEQKLNGADPCSSGCCSQPTPSACAVKDMPSDSIEIILGTVIPDLEKGIASKEHITLSISGMTCTGCETKLNRTLGTLQSVHNLKTSLVLSRAEFDLDIGIQSLDEVFRYLEKATEFKYERISDQGLHVDIVVPDASEFMKQDWPHGVTEMTLVDERTVNVAFDAKIVGARDLLGHGWGRTLYLAPLRPDASLTAGNKHVRHMGYMTILSIIPTVPILVLAWAPLPKRELAYGSAQLALATIVQVVVAGPFYPKALKALIFSRIIEMDLLIVLSTSAAYIFSVVSFGYLVAGHALATGGFFETCALLVTLIMVGRYVAALARQKAVESISLRSLQTPTAILVDESGANGEEIDVRLLQYGDIFKVIPDSKIPTDGTVIGGSSEVDESMITGESIPVDKSLKSAVIAGSVNGSGTLIVKLARLPAENTISVISGMVDQAKLSKPKIQDIADRVASYFVPVVIALTIITFVIWIAVGIAVRNQSGSRATTEAITYAITVLIVSCPCAIGLAVPMVIVIASGVAAERGVIFKAADSIETAYKTSHVVFDKTGTLTQGKLTVAVEHIDSTKDSMSLLIGLIGSNKHPISTAVAAHLKATGVSASTVSDTTVLTGKGVEGSASGLILRAGNSRWLNLSSNPQVQSVLEQGYTAFCFTINGSLAAVFGLQDSLRPDALETVSKLQERGILVHLLSGDDNGPVQSIARQLGIPIENVRSRCTPVDKQAYIQSLATPSSDKGPTTTIFIGDGTNDAIALATATIGVHMNQETGSDVAKSAADVVLMRPSLLGILTMINISQKVERRIKFNFGWSFVYNLFAVLLSAGAFVDARIPPEYAGLGELVSVLPVIVAAVLLRWEGV